MKDLLKKYKDHKPKEVGNLIERQYPESAVIEIIRELQCFNLPILFAEWLSKNQWAKRTHTHPNKIGWYYSNLHCEYKRIEDLFDEFLNTINP